MNSLYKRSKAALIMALIVLLVSGCSKQESSPQGAGAWGSRQANIPAVETVIRRLEHPNPQSTSVSADMASTTF